MLVLSVGVGNGVATVGIGVAADGGVAAGGAAGIDWCCGCCCLLSFTVMLLVMVLSMLCCYRHYYCLHFSFVSPCVVLLPSMSELSFFILERRSLFDAAGSCLLVALLCG